MLTRATILSIIVVYLFSVLTMLGFVGSTFGDENYYTQVQKVVGVGFVANIITGVSILPIWLNTLLFGIPVGLLAYLIIASFTPTTNAGA